MANDHIILTCMLWNFLSRMNKLSDGNLCTKSCLNLFWQDVRSQLYIHRSSLMTFPLISFFSFLNRTIMSFPFWKLFSFEGTFVRGLCKKTLQICSCFASENRSCTWNSPWIDGCARCSFCCGTSHFRIYGGVRK